MVARLNLNINMEYLNYLYTIKKLTIAEIGSLFNCGRKPIRRLMKKYNIKVRTRSEVASLNQPRKLDSVIKEELEYLYNVKQLSGIEISKIFDCSYVIVYNQLRKYGISVRDSKECVAHLDRTGKNNSNYKDGNSNILSLLRSSTQYKEWRNKIYKKDSYTCQECLSKGKGNLEAHHKYPIAIILSEFLKEYDQFSPIKDKETLLRLATKYKPFWDLDNGITLCKECHNKIYQNTKKVIKQIRGD